MIDFDPACFYRDYIEALNERRLTAMDQFIHDEVLRNGEPSTRPAAVADMASYIEAVPDARWEIIDLAVDRDMIAVRLSDTGTPRQTWLGLEPTGASIRFMELAFYKVRDGRFSEMNWVMNVLDVRRQLVG